MSRPFLRAKLWQSLVIGNLEAERQIAGQLPDDADEIDASFAGKQARATRSVDQALLGSRDFSWRIA